MNRVSSILALAAFFFTTAFVISSLYLIHDRSLPYWDTVHYDLQAQRLARAILKGQGGFAAVRALFQSAQPPGYALPMLPFYAFGGIRWEMTRLAFCCMYGPLAAVGVFLLSLEYTWGNKKASVFSSVCSFIIPLFWFEGLRGMADVASYAITPWIIWLWNKSEHCRRKWYCLALGFMLGWGLLCRRRFILVFLLWGFICCADIFAVWMKNRRVNAKHDLIDMVRGLFLIVVSSTAIILVFCPVRYFGQFYDPSNAATLYLFAIRNLFYAGTLPFSGLGPVLALPSIVAFVLAMRFWKRFWPLLVWAGLFYFGTEFLLAGQEERNALPMLPPLFVLIGWLICDKFQGLVRRIAAGWILGIGSIQLLWGLAGIKLLGTLPVKMLGVGWLSFPPQQYPINSIIGAMQLMSNDSVAPKVFVASSSVDLNWTQLLWLAETGQLPQGFRPVIYHADVPRNHGFPIDFPSMDFILLKDKNYTHLKPGVEYACDLIVQDFLRPESQRIFLRNFREEASFPYLGEASLHVLKRFRQLSLAEEKELWKAFIAADPDNFYCTKPRIWLISHYLHEGNEGGASAVANELLERMPMAVKVSRVEPVLQIFGISLAMQALGSGEAAIGQVRVAWERMLGRRRNIRPSAVTLNGDWIPIERTFGDGRVGCVYLSGITPIRLDSSGSGKLLIRASCVERVRVAAFIKLTVVSGEGFAEVRPDLPFHLWRTGEKFDIGAVIRLDSHMPALEKMLLRVSVHTDIGSHPPEWKSKGVSEDVIISVPIIRDNAN